MVCDKTDQNPIGELYPTNSALQKINWPRAHPHTNWGINQPKPPVHHPVTEF